MGGVIQLAGGAPLGGSGLDASEVAKILGGLAALNYFPTDDKARWAILCIVGDMAADLEQVRWLVRRMLQIFNRWPGPADMRAVFCAKYLPADGIVSHYSEVLGGDVPSERAAALAVVDVKALPAGSEDERVEVAMKCLNFAVQEKCRAFKAPPTPEEIAAAPEWLRRLEGYE